MSMMGQFREITPSLLGWLKDQPSLTESVLHADLVGDPNLSDFDTVIQALPPKYREMMKASLETMSPDQRAKMEAYAASAAPALREIGADLRERTKDQQLPQEGLGEQISLEKAWHGLHFLLCGSAEPLPGEFGQAVLGGVEIGEDLGYGPARYLEPDNVRRIANALDSITVEELKKRYDPVVMEEADIYPGGWTDLENLDWLMEAFHDLITYYKSVAERGNAILLYLV